MSLEDIFGPMDLSDEIGLESLPPKERLRAIRLRDCLAMPRWVPFETRAILTGFHPEASEAGFDPVSSPTDSMEGLALLPGIPANEHIEEIKRRFVVISRIKALERTIRPYTALSRALAAGVTPPWYEFAMNDDECLKRLREPHPIWSPFLHSWNQHEVR